MPEGGMAKSPRVGRLLRLESLVTNALDAAAWARARFGRPPVVVGSSQGGVLAIIAATRDHQLAGVVAHNIFDPALAESITVSRFPTFLKAVYRPFLRGLRVLAKLAPRLPHPVQRLPRSVPGMPRALVSRAVPAGPAEPAQLLPLAFLADLFTADMIAMRDGTISCPVVVVAARGDPLFNFDYTQTVFTRVAAPAKELVVFDTEHHLLFNECLPLVLPRVAELITHLGAKQPTQLGTTG